MTEPHRGQVLLLDLVESVSFQDPLGKGKKSNQSLAQHFATVIGSLPNGIRVLLQPKD